MKSPSELKNCYRAWSLIEIIGVMAVIGILALAIAPALMRAIERHYRQDEVNMLRRMSDGLQQSILRNHAIPDHTGFAAAIAVELGLDEASVRTNRIKQARVFLIDPALHIGTGAGTTLPYSQGIHGSTNPASPRVLFVSSLSVPLPQGIQSGVAESTNAFNAIWDTAENSVPAGWAWTGRGEDLKIQRLNLMPLFVPLILNNNSPAYGRFAIDEAAHEALTANTFQAYYLLGTRLKLYGSDGTLQSTEILQDPRTFVYENGIWRGKLFLASSGRRLGGADLQAAYELFMSSPPNENAKFGTTQGEVTASMLTYMSNYINWAVSGFSSSKKSAVQSAATAMGDKTKNYLFRAGAK